MKIRLRIFILLFLLVPAAPAMSNAADIPRRISALLVKLDKALTASRQVLYVDPDDRAAIRATAYLLERKGASWSLALGPFPAILGRNGMAPAWEKREGDGRTPSGVFPLRQAFGYPAAIHTRLDYRQSQPDDIWVDDVLSPDYNHRVKVGQTGASSFEYLVLDNDAYKYGLIVEYNSHPTIKGFGSAIFVHVRKGKGMPTAGCISLAEHNLKQILGWLDPQQKPVLVAGTPKELEAFVSGPAEALPADIPETIRSRLGAVSRRLGQWRVGNGFFAMATTVPDAVASSMLEKRSWRPGCPVPIDDLAYVVSNYHGFDGRTQYGELVVHVGLSGFVLDILKGLYENGFPIERMELIENYDADDDRSMAANNTSAFNCRDITGKPGFFSKHSYGGAIDINPVQNPYVSAKAEALKKRGWDGDGTTADYLKRIGYGGASPISSFCAANPSECNVLPPGGLPYLERRIRHTGMLAEGDRAVALFRQKGFDWGGEWVGKLDYQHFEFDWGRLSR
ncbi:M15 family metallopeptidase [Desulfatirhabdium butyrativorans]|uniref:M15 family metallopeptidase n=1 Tax=Desulfatirhabdium butyrativorans TaxID=340467 RepID=UPI000412DF13|nr:M15 family metallopeptidase [Desulfatirhabdium butyrativorans]